MIMNKDTHAFFSSSASSSSSSSKRCGLDQEKPHLLIPPKSTCVDPERRVSCRKLSPPVAERPAEPPSVSPSDHHDESSRSSIKFKYQRVFQYFDKDEDGRISPAEVCACLATLKEEISLEEAEALVESADWDGDGFLSLEEFVGLVEVDNIGEEEKKNELREAFGMYEMDGSGCITPKSLKRMLSRLGESKTMEECSTMISRFDLDGDGVLSFDEFVVMMN